MSTEGHSYSIGYDPRALKELGRFDRQVARRIVDAVNTLASNPRPSGVRPLVGYDDLWRIRIGGYRVIYTIKEAEASVLVLRIAHPAP